ncbi:CheR family methyltransferase [Mariniphaga sediminis]|uniref:CheR family methyltransferase n=1 Tax=Mariniphaga sediminis TaxID=1628158 RepID=UPI003565FE8E
MPSETKNDRIFPVSPEKNDTQNIELDLLLQAVFLKYGYDFRNYSKAHLKRRINQRLNISNLETISELQNKILWDKEFFRLFLKDLSINVTEMFRDPDFYAAFREKVVSVLKTYAHIKVWHAGCATGEEVYSLAIILKEENLLARTQIYATDINKSVLETAKQGIYSKKEMELYERNYKEAGGKGELSDYYTSKYGSVLFDKSLSKNIVFADHNLVTDGVFAEVHLIFCRNVLIYFDKLLQNKVLGLFSDSLAKRGFLCLGTKESLKFTDYENKFQAVDKKMRIYKKLYIPK